MQLLSGLGRDSADRREDHRADPTTLLLAGKIALVAASYYVAAELGLRFALVERNVTPLWPPTGIAVVALLAWGTRIWPGIAIAAFVANVPISAGLVPAAITAAGNTAAPLAAVGILKRLGFRREIDRLRDAQSIVIAALAGMAISATVGAGTLVLSDAIPASDFLSAWAVWWTGDAMGVLVVAPFLLSLPQLRRLPELPWMMRLEYLALFVFLTSASLVAIKTDLWVLFALLLLLGWAAWRFQQRGAAPAALLVSGLATWAAARGMGPFQAGTLFQKMLELQAFNATVAFTSFFFAALVAERLRTARELQASAVRLEKRVRDRTSELTDANERLRHEVAERRTAEDRLRQRERQLAEAQQVATMGSWEWLIPENRVTWSDEMYRIHGFLPQQFEVDFDKAVERVREEDLERIMTNVQGALGLGRDHDLPSIEYRIVRTDGEERMLLGKARLLVDTAGSPRRLVGSVQDVTDNKRAEQEHEIAEVLQRSLLPNRLPQIPGIALAARYVPATVGARVGGDWYDVVHLPNGDVAIAIGDVVGHGMQAASSMGQLRMAVRAYALDEHSPADVLSRLHRLVERLNVADMATIAYIVFSPSSEEIRYTIAGHPPPLVIDDAGSASYLREAATPPLGAAANGGDPVEFSANLPIGSTLLLFTDGLLERRDRPLQDGLIRLREVAAGPPADVESLCDRLLASLLTDDVEDDVALLALRRVPLTTGPIRIVVPAEPQVLASVRQTMRLWLRELSTSSEEANDILVACGEACSNAIQHAYGGGEGSIEIELSCNGREVALAVSDTGTWRSPSRDDSGHGLGMMRALMDSVDIDAMGQGTRVRLRRRLDDGGRG